MGKLEYMKKYNQQQNSENEQFVEKKTYFGNNLST